MSILMSVLLLFGGIGVLVLLHICIVGRTLRRALANAHVNIHGVAERRSLASSSMSREDVEKLPSFRYKDNVFTNIGNPKECSVCLEDLKVGDNCRLLPLCKHSFHADCVDVWLLKSTRCPICRTSAESSNREIKFDHEEVILEDEVIVQESDERRVEISEIEEVEDGDEDHVVIDMVEVEQKNDGVLVKSPLRTSRFRSRQNSTESNSVNSVSLLDHEASRASREFTSSVKPKLPKGSDEEEVNEVGQTRSTKLQLNSCIDKLLEGSDEEKKSEEVNEVGQTRSCIDKLLEGSNEENNYSEVGDCSTEEFVLRYYKVYEFDSCVAEVPSEGGICGACGEGKGEREVVVCDGCEEGFHVECVGVMKGEVDEWMCRECEKKRRKGRKRKGGDLWSFGVKSKRRKRIHVPHGGGIRQTSAGDNIRTKAMGSDPEGSDGTSETMVVDDELGESPVKVAKKQDCTNSDDLLPLQYADFFVLSAGKIDVRSTYHSAYQIWPVGFKSCYHDNITGSLFVSEVLDGGEPGPQFKVRRFPCCQSSIPVATTLLSDTTRCLNGQKETDGCVTTYKYDSDEYDSVVPMLADPCLPMVGDLLAPIDSGFDECLVSQLSEHVHQKIIPLAEKFESNDLCELRDEVGELLVEESSSSLAWRSMARKFLNSCHDIVSRSGCLKFSCPHLAGRTHIGCHDRLLKFFGMSPSLSIPPVITKEKLDSLSGELLKWLEEDRFGLSEDFIQEVVEKLPDAHFSANYILLNQRDPPTSLVTVQNGTLIANVKGGADAYEMERQCLPLGKPINKMLSPKLFGDVFQVWQFLWRFRGILGLDLPLSFVDLESQLIDPWVGHSDPLFESRMESGSMALPERTALLSKDEFTSYFLTKVHTSLLQVLLAELESKIVAMIEPCDDAGDMKRKRGRKKDVNRSLASKVMNFRTLPLNELTWPELARRYVLAFSLLDGNMNSSNWTYDTSSRVLQCLRGDGGVLCGSLGGVAAIGVDALILADATRSIFGCLNRETDMLGIGGNVPEGNNSFENGMSEDVLPDWAEVLVPVQKLPTNVGSRIRNRVREALDKGPPEWAREILEDSISKEVYKGNASGPTKRAAVSVLMQVLGEVPQSTPPSGKKPPSAKKRREKYVSISSFMMKQCRIVLRETAAADEKKAFCYLLGRRLQTCGSDDGILGSNAVVSRPLDFRTIDIRLAAGAYHGSHEAFLEDVRELWMTIRTTYGDRPDLLLLADKLSTKFESLYEQKVNALYQELVKYSKLKNASAVSTKKIEDLLHSICDVDIPKAPWDKGICKVCGINRDDKSVLLCDECDGEYHTYCLDPPLAKIPEGNWFCPFCISHKHPFNDASTRSETIHKLQKKGDGKYTRRLFEMIDYLSNTMGKTDYWELSLNGRVCLLQFLCDEMLTSSPLRQHLETCAGLRDGLNTKLCTPPEIKTKLHTLSAYTPSEYKRKLRSPPAYKAHNPKQDTPGKNPSSQCTDGSSSDISQGDNKAVGGKNLKGFDCGKVSVSMDHSEAQNGDSELDSYKSNSQLQQISVNGGESQQEELSLRSKFLGSDSAGRFYWAMVTPGNQISVVVNENKQSQGGKTTFASAQDKSSEKGPWLRRTNRNQTLGGSNVPCPFTHEFSHDGVVSSGWVWYESDVEIKGLLDFLKDDHDCERQLRDSILKSHKRFSKRQRFRKQEVGSRFSSPLSQNFLKSDCSMSRARNLLEFKYGSFVEPKAKSSSMLKGKAVGLDGMYRCECLEPVWPSRLHCSSCHKTFLLKVDYKVHGCQSSALVPVEDPLEGKGTINPGNGSEKYLDNRICTGPESELNSMRSNRDQATHNLADICSKFVTECSNRELVKTVGLISSNGVPSFVPLESPYLSDPALKLHNYQEDARCHISTDLPSEPIQLSVGKISEAHDSLPLNSPKDSVEPAADEGSAFPPQHYCGNLFKVSDTSLRPLVGRACEVLRRIKIQLLDMDAVLPEAALRSSKSLLERRSTWCSFVKSAQTIYEIVQAMVVLEDSIKAEYLSDTWLHWSSLSAAANISTLSALALRLYSLDAVIQYERTSPKDLSSKKKRKQKKSSPDENPDKKMKGDNQTESKQ